jgi:hypothetical protein
MANNLDIQKSEVSEKLAEYQLEMLPGNAAPQEKRKREISLESVVLNGGAAEFNARRDFLRTTLELDGYESEVEVLDRQLDLEIEQVEDYRLRFEAGRISEEQYKQKRMQALLARRDYIEELRAYTQFLFASILNNGQVPEAVLP